MLATVIENVLRLSNRKTEYAYKHTQNGTDKHGYEHTHTIIHLNKHRCTYFAQLFGAFLVS